LGNLEADHFPETLKDRWRALETERLSLLELYEGKVEGELLYWGPRRICSVRLWKWASVSMADQFWGTWGDSPFLETLREG